MEEETPRCHSSVQQLGGSSSPCEPPIRLADTDRVGCMAWCKVLKIRSWVRHLQTIRHMENQDMWARNVILHTATTDEAPDTARGTTVGTAAYSTASVGDSSPAASVPPHLPTAGAVNPIDQLTTVDVKLFRHLMKHLPEVYK